MGVELVISGCCGADLPRSVAMMISTSPDSRNAITRGMPLRAAISYRTNLAIAVIASVIPIAQEYLRPINITAARIIQVSDVMACPRRKPWVVVICMVMVTITNMLKYSPVRPKIIGRGFGSTTMVLRLISALMSMIVIATVISMLPSMGRDVVSLNMTLAASW